MSKRPARFHINKKGEIAPCAAMNGKCPYIDFSDESFGHYRTVEEMEEYLERRVSLGSLESDSLNEDEFYRTDLPALRPTENLMKHKIYKEPGDSLSLVGNKVPEKEDVRKAIESRAVYLLARSMEMERAYLKESLTSPYESLDDYKELAATALYSTDTGRENLGRIFEKSPYETCLGIKGFIDESRLDKSSNDFSLTEFLNRVPSKIGEGKDSRDLRSYALYSVESSMKLSQNPYEFNAVSAWTSGGPILAAMQQGNKDKASIANQHGKLSKEDLDSYIGLVNQAIERATPKVPKGKSLPKVYKGISTDKFLRDYQIDVDKEVYGNADPSSLEGKEISFRTPSSTTISETVARGFGAVVLEIQPKKAAFVGAQSSWGFREEEVLLQGDTKYKIKKAERKIDEKGYSALHLELEETE